MNPATAIDLTLPLRQGMRGVNYEECRTLDRDGWNARTLHLYSHAGTHMDAQTHFGAGRETIDKLPLERCMGPAWVVRLPSIAPSTRITPDHLGDIAGRFKKGESLLLHTGWSAHEADPTLYRDGLPRISESLALWCVERGVRILGVEPPSVADVNQMDELTHIHRILLSSQITIVEGLTGLDRIAGERCFFAAFPLPIEGGDGCPLPRNCVAGNMIPSLSRNNPMPTRFLVVIGTFLIALLLYIDRTCIQVAGDAIKADLSLTDKQFGWVLSIFTLGYALAQTPSGILADRLGPRGLLAGVIAMWSALTALTAAGTGFISLLVIRFVFGASEAGAFPGMARAAFSWFPTRERGLVTGINFSASRLGGALALPMMVWLIQAAGWRGAFVALGLIGIGFAVLWWWFFRDTPEQHPRIQKVELATIVAGRQQPNHNAANHPPGFAMMIRDRNVVLLMAQYFCSNFTFFFCLSWLFTHIKKTYDLTAGDAGLLAALPLLGGAAGNWFSGWLVDFLYRKHGVILSRRLPAVVGFILAAVGLLASLHMASAIPAVLCLSLAVFGADMTLSPSWAACVDIGGRVSGAVSGTMNMAGNLGAFATSLAFPYLLDWFGSSTPFFHIAAALNIAAVFIWLGVRPQQTLERSTP